MIHAAARTTLAPPAISAIVISTRLIGTPPFLLEAVPPIGPDPVEDLCQGTPSLP